MASLKTDRKTTTFDLGEFQVDPRRRTISGPYGETMVEPKIMAVLLMLAEHPGEVISRAEFLDSVWANEYGGDESLTRSISLLRKAFNDDRGVHTSIETIPRTGYRLTYPDQTLGVAAKKGGLSRLLTAGITLVLVIMFVTVLIKKTGDETTGKLADNTVSIVLAVLPFDSQGEVTEDVSIARGLANEILSALSQSPSISVIADNSSFQLKGNYKQDLEVLSRQLNISHVIDGLVRRSSGSLQIGVRLVEVETGRVVWSDVMNPAESEVYTIPKLVAFEVQTALGTNLTKAGPQSTTPPDPAAYAAYLQARALIRETSDWNLGKAINILENAVSMDPNLSEAWAALAWARLDLAHVEGSGKPDSLDQGPLAYLQAARRDANSALAIDPTSIDALLVLAILNLMDRTDTLVETEGRIRSLLARAPNHSNVNMRMGLLLMSVGRWQEATTYMKTALDLNPLSSLTSFYYGTALLGSGSNEELRIHLGNINAIDSYRRSYPWLVERLVEKDYQAARDFFAPLDSDNVFHSKGLGLAENIDADSPRAIRLRSLVDRLVTAAERRDAFLDMSIGSDMIRAADEGLMPQHFVCVLLAAAGLNDAAFDLARKRISLGEVWYREIILMPAFSKVRHDQRIMELFVATGQIDYWQQTGNWPDFCSTADLPYDCENAAIQYREKH